MDNIIFKLFDADKIIRGKVPPPDDLIVGVQALRTLWRLEDNPIQHQQGQVQLLHKLRFLSLHQNSQQIQEWHKLLLQHEKMKQEQREIERKRRELESQKEEEEDDYEKNKQEIAQLIQELRQKLDSERQVLEDQQQSQQSQQQLLCGRLKEQGKDVPIIQRIFNKYKCKDAPEAFSEEQKQMKVKNPSSQFPLHPHPFSSSSNAFSQICFRSTDPVPS